MHSNGNPYRKWILLSIFALFLLAVIAKFVYLTTCRRPFLVKQSDYHAIHYQTIQTTRGNILSRDGMPLAVSAPIYDVIFDPKIMRDYASQQQIKALAAIPAIGLTDAQIQQILQDEPNSQYHPVQNGLAPGAADKIRQLYVPGVAVIRHFQRFYPLGKAAAQVVGFTDQRSQGQDGLELAFNSQLQNHAGHETVLRNARGQVLKILHIQQKPKPGKDVTLSIDSRIQSFVYEALKKEVTKSHAISGSAVVLQPATGEVLAAGTYPSFNPNRYDDRVGPQVRDRVMTDTFEPGSVMKILTIAAALESGKYTPESKINTNPGYYFIHGYRVRDDANFGLITLTGIITKSSNVGISKVAWSLNHRKVYDMFVKAGVGSPPSGIFPGEAAGILHPFSQMGHFEFATMTFGYALSVSLLQLARIYGAVANDGILEPISFTKVKTPPKGKYLMSPKTAHEIIKILHTVEGPKGTGLLANVPGFCVAGKTGTTHQVGPHGFYKHRYNAVFVGMLPCSHPDLVIAVRMNNPRGRYNEFGGVSAAPVFAQVAQRSLMTLGYEPNRRHIDHSLFANEASFARIIAGN